MKRRYFLSRSALSLATGAILPATVAASEKLKTSEADGFPKQEGNENIQHTIICNASK